MNSKENSTGMVVPAMPRGDMSITVDMTKLATLSMYELFGLRRSVHIIVDHMAAMLCQPKFGRDDSNEYNGSGEILEAIEEWLCTYEQGIVNVAKSASLDTEKEAEWRAWLLLGFETDCTDDLATMAVMTAQSVKDVQGAKFAKDHCK